MALENERKIQQLQMQAINALWKKVSTLQPNPAATAALTSDLQALAGGSEVANTNSTAVVQDLAKTCTVLTNQVIRLYFLHSSLSYQSNEILTVCSFDLGSTIARINARHHSMHDCIL